ncbi:uncharacterized protein LOC142985927 [Anticarsia gemmatalis]
MLSKIKEALPDFQPIKFTLDFEMSAMIAINEVFPETTIHGCFVHFQRSIYRKAQSLKLMDHKETAQYVKLCISLAFLPKDEIEDGWLAVMGNSYPDPLVTEFNDYFVTQWLEPQGMIEKWCCYQERHRTTNLVEAWNQRLQAFLGKNPSLLAFLDMIELDISTYDTAQERLRIKKQSIIKRSKQSRNNDKAIARLTEEYKKGKINMISFLEDIRTYVIIKKK